MMTPEAFTPVSTRVSILERVIPSIGFIVTAMSGAIGAMLVFRFFNELRSAQSAGFAAFFGGTAEIEFAVGIVLVIAAMLGAIGIVVSIIRLFTTNTTSSPPGVLFLLLGALSLVPPFLIHYIMHMMKGVVVTPTPGGVSSVADTVRTVCYIAIGAAFIISLILLAFSFVPYSSRTGRKASTVICLILVEALVVVLAGIYFWQARESLVERDKDRVDEYSQPKEPPTMPSDNTQIPGIPGDIIEGVSNTSSNAGGRTVSGGVLNAKAVELPEAAFPPAARAIRASGAVSVQVTVDERGNVVSASAVSGHPLLRAAAVSAARKAKFKPTMLSGQSVKVTGVIVYNFVP